MAATFPYTLDGSAGTVVTHSPELPRPPCYDCGRPLASSYPRGEAWFCLACTVRHHRLQQADARRRGR
jgi:hypothetical protein